MDSSHIVGREEEQTIQRQRMPPQIMENLDPAPEAGGGAVASDAAEAVSLPPSWEWDSLLDFTLDESSILSWESGDRLLEPDPLPDSVAIPISQSQATNSRSERVRKRDPRMSCENFLAGRVPCACPELDEKEEEEQHQQKRKKQSRMSSVAGIRCQVPSCEADIRELKGYHRRHRVCLRCANASAVILGGQRMRYCQQCGKFHVLSDFDEGKRSCRRKLERHNNRRRKNVGVTGVAGKETDVIISAEDAACEAETGRDMLNTSTSGELCLTNELQEIESALECEDGNHIAFSSVPNCKNVQGDHVASFVTSENPRAQEGKDCPKPFFSSSLCSSKCVYSSVCPTGRMSFKLYDWNPAEFPRRLRHQIFQWLASMPVELEGYIRPGCTILTLFIALPQFMWSKLSEDALSALSDLINAPGSLLFRRSSMRIYLKDQIFQVLKDGTSLIDVKMGSRVPRIHYVHPNYFEAGQSMEFVVCGNNIFQPKFRLLVSFAGKYLEHQSCLAIPQKIRLAHSIDSESTDSFDHEMFKICISGKDLKIFGPAFIEVENESGLSNFIPVIIGDRQICSELGMLQQRFESSGGSLSSENSCTQPANVDGFISSCQTFVSKQTAMSDLLLDIAWLLRNPQIEKNLSTSTLIQRLNYLFRFLIQHNCLFIMERLFKSSENVMKAVLLYGSEKINDADLKSFQKYMVWTTKILHDGILISKLSTAESETHPQTFLSKGKVTRERRCILPSSDQVAERPEDGLTLAEAFASQESDMLAPLVNKDVVMDVKICSFPPEGMKWPQKAYAEIFPSSIKRSHLLYLSMAAFALCFSICTVVGYPHQVRRFAVSLRTCLFGNPIL